jgi:MFS family permease
MSLAPAAALSPAEVERGLRLVIRDGVCTQILITLVGGVFLTDFALGLGAGSLALGTIMAMPALGNLFQLPAIALVEALRRRRAIVVAMSGPARLLFFVVVALPFLPILPQTAVAVLIAALAAIYALGSISHCAWNSWMRDLVPPARLGGFFGRRMMVMAALGAVLVPLAGFYVDGFRSAWPDLRSYVYAPLFATGAAAGVIGVWILALTPEPAMAPTAETEGFARRVLAPLRDPDFRGVLVFLFAWNATVNLAAPFFAAYMLTRLGLDVGQATLLTAIFQLANLVAYGPWGRIADRRTNRAVLGVCVPVFMAAIPGFVVAAIPTVPTLALAWLFALHVALGFAHAGVQLTGMTVAIKLAPRAESTSYLAAVHVAANVAAGVAPILGGWIAAEFADLTLTIPLPLRDRPFVLVGWDVLFCSASACGLAAVLAVSSIREAGTIGWRRTLAEFAGELGAEFAAGGRWLTRRGGSP